MSKLTFTKRRVFQAIVEELDGFGGLHFCLIPADVRYAPFMQQWTAHVGQLGMYAGLFESEYLCISDNPRVVCPNAHNLIQRLPLNWRTVEGAGRLIHSVPEKIEALIPELLHLQDDIYETEGERAHLLTSEGSFPGSEGGLI